MMYSLAGKCPLPCTNGHHHERNIHVSVALVLIGLVSNISQRPNMFVDFLLQRRLALKNKWIKSGMKSLSIICVGGRGQPMLAGRIGGVGMEPKKCDKKRWVSCDIFPLQNTFY
jgi:hypothetical protein